MNGDIRGAADRLAAEGYLAVAPQFYHRSAPARVELPRDDEGRAAGFGYLGQVTRDDALADMRAVLDYLGDPPVGVLGFSAGGHLAYLAATQLPIRATAVLYGGWLPNTDIPRASAPRHTDNFSSTGHGVIHRSSVRLPLAYRAEHAVPVTSTFARRRRDRLARVADGRLVAVPDKLTELAAHQHGVLHRDQLRAHGFDMAKVRAAVAAQRWQAIGRNAVVLHNGPLSTRQREWVAVLLPAKPAALAGPTAAMAAGLRGFEPDEVHIVVAHDTHTRVPAWVKLHESRRLADADIRVGSGPPRTSTARSVVDAATWSRSPRRACAVLCAAVQQRLITANRLTAELRKAGSVRHVSIMRDVLGDIGGGGHTLAEIDLTPLARRAGLPPPRRQALRPEPSGRVRYVDAEFDLPDGTTLAVEVDGAVHLKPMSWWDDMARQNELIIRGQPVLRYPSLTIRVEQASVVDQLRRIRLAHTPP